MKADLIQELESLATLENEYIFDYLLDEGKSVTELPDEYRTYHNEIQGCQSRVWIVSEQTGNVWNFVNAENLSIKEFNVTIRSFFADEDESCSKHFTIMFKMIHRSNSVDRVIMVADSEDLNNAFQFSPELLEKNLFLFRDDHDTNIDFSINFVNIAYMIAQSLGLDRGEW